MNARNEISLDIGYVNPNIPKNMVSYRLTIGLYSNLLSLQDCQKCRGIIEKAEMAVIAPKLGENQGWHPACFTCVTCNEVYGSSIVSD